MSYIMPYPEIRGLLFQQVYRENEQNRTDYNMHSVNTSLYIWSQSNVKAVLFYIL